MGAREMLRFHCPNFSLPVEDLNAKEIFDQFLFLDAGLADKKDPKTGVSLGLSENLSIRREELRKKILTALEQATVNKKVLEAELA